MSASQGHENGFAGAMVHAPERPKALAPDAARAFEPSSISDAVRLAELLVASRLLPRAVSTPEAAFAIIATGRELGLTAMQSLRSIHVIEGKPTLSSDLVLALVKSRRDVCMWFRLVESTDQVATYETHRVGEPSPTRMSFSMADAQRAGVTGKDNWRKYPAAMLRARCITALARAVYPDLAMGVYDPDELEAAPVPAPQPVEVVREPAKPAATPTETLLKISVDIAASTTNVALNKVAAGVSRAHKAGKISDDDLERAKVMIENRRKAIEPPPPPPSSGTAVAQSEAAEAEAEAEADAMASDVE